MRALLVHDTAAGGDAAAALHAAGYDVVRCTPPDQDPSVCAAVDGDCPLDAAVDVAVAVHDRPTTALAPGEVGVVCARRDRVPVVAAGAHPELLPGGGADAVATSTDPGSLAVACAEARRVAAARAATLIARIAGADVTVSRDGEAVDVTVSAGAADGTRKAVRAHQAARALFPSARTITVRHT